MESNPRPPDTLIPRHDIGAPPPDAQALRAGPPPEARSVNTGRMRRRVLPDHYLQADSYRPCERRRALLDLATGTTRVPAGSTNQSVPGRPRASRSSGAIRYPPASLDGLRGGCLVTRWFRST